MKKVILVISALSLVFLSCEKDNEGVYGDAENESVAVEESISDENKSEQKNEETQSSQDLNDFFNQDVEDDCVDCEPVELCATKIRDGGRLCRNDLSLEAACDFANELRDTGWYTDIDIDGSPYMDVCFPAKKAY